MKTSARALAAIKRRLARGEQPVLFLDFDGTLAPIVRELSKARMSGAAQRALSRLAKSCPTYIVSGRKLSDLNARARIGDVELAGNHGMEWRVGKRAHRVHVPSRAQKDLRAAHKALMPLPRFFAGSKLEDKGLSIAYHYRNVPGKRAAVALALAERRLAPILEHGTLEALSHKMSLDIRPKGWHKGDFVRAMLRRAPKKSFAVYIGDDATDEDAFAAIRSKGIGIRIGKRASSQAAYYLPSQGDVAKFLARLAADSNDR